MVVITGAAGFIGSYVASALSKSHKLILLDDFGKSRRVDNHLDFPDKVLVHRDEGMAALEPYGSQIKYFLHLGARTDTAEQDWALFRRLNLDYSKEVWSFCVRYRIPLIYASSAATYGDGSLGFGDKLEDLSQLKPLNPYGRSKQEFDLWALNQDASPPSWAGLKFFNVFGPNEYHKGRMASVVFHAYNQIKDTSTLRLFRSHKDAYKDGEQKRDFVYVKDVYKVISYLMGQKNVRDIFNLGTGQARTFNDLGAAVFEAMEMPINIQYIDTPEDIRESYQYYTQADMQKLTKLGYTGGFLSLEEAVSEYVRGFLSTQTYF